MVGPSRTTVRIGVWFFLPLLFLTPVHTARGQSSWERYKPGTLAAIMAQHDSVIRASWSGKNPSEHFSGYDFPTIASIIYGESARPVDPDRLGIIRSWVKTFRRDSTITREFHREYLFQEGKQLLWLPVQDTVASFFAKELLPGQRVKLYVMWLGAYYAGLDVKWTFLANEFEADTAKQ
jgi:hypothetical protein